MLSEVQYTVGKVTAVHDGKCTCTVSLSAPQVRTIERNVHELVVRKAKRARRGDLRAGALDWRRFTDRHPLARGMHDLHEAHKELDCLWPVAATGIGK